MSRGAVSAARSTRNELREVGSQARRTDNDLGKLSRGALAGSGAFRGLGRSIAFASVGFLGGFGLTAAIGGAVKELRDSIRVSAQTSQALRSTGNVAGTSAKLIDTLANSLLRKTGVDDEAIKTAANLLLTFTQVRNEVGRGNDVYNQSVKAVVDMSAVIGDLSSNSITLGKALNDPVRGMTALRRIGVSFTQQQVEQVKALMEHGRILQAQKIILREVNVEFGGQAAAQEKATGGLNTLRETIKNTSAELLRGLLPSFREMVASLQKQVDWLTTTREGQAKLRSVSNALKDALLAIVDAVKLFISGIRIANRITGGLKETLELVIALKLATVISGWTKSFTLLAGAETAAGGTGLAGAAAGSSRLLTTLRALAKIGVITVGIEILTGGGGKGPAGGRYSGSKGWGNLWRDITPGFISGSDPKTGPKGGAAGTGLGSVIAAAAVVSGASGKVTMAPGADRGGAHTKPHVIKFVARIAGIVGKTLRITTGTNHNEFVVGTHRQSQHWTGDAADIAASGSWLTTLGQAALVAAGADPAWARKQSGGAYTINGVQCIFNSNVGGNHFNHLHVGLTSLPKVGGYGDAPKTVSPDTADYTPHDTAALSTPAKKTGSKGATAPTLISIRGGIDETLRKFGNLTPAIKAQLSTVGLEAEKHLEQLRAHLKKGMSSKDLAQTRKGITHWGAILKEEIAKATTAAKTIAAEAAAKLALAFDRQFRDASTGVFRIFDRQTDSYVRNFQRDTEKAISGMRQAFDRQMQAFDDETRRGLLQFVVPQTGAEGALAAFQAARQAEADAKAMADAQASGDPEQIRQLQLDLQERALEEAAKQSRDAQDKATDDQQRNYQQQRDDQRNALQEQEALREQAYQDQREATLAVYQQQRDDQRQALQDDLDDWMLWVETKKKTWQEFLAWLAQRGFAVPSGWDTRVDDDQIQRNLFGIGSSDRPTGLQEGAGFARGGKLPGRYIGREDTVMYRGTPGETVIDRSLTQALEQMVAGGGGGGPNITIKIGSVIGTTPRDVWRSVAKEVDPELKRLIGYTAA